jgi:hypothetical protein
MRHASVGHERCERRQAEASLGPSRHSHESHRCRSWEHRCAGRSRNSRRGIIQPRQNTHRSAKRWIGSTNAPQRIAGCIRRHRLGAPRVSVGISGGGITYPRHSAIFKRCDWPPLTPGSRDGYTEVRVQDVDLPKPAAAPYNTLGTFRAQCDQLDVTFVLDHMLARLFTSKRLDLSRIYEVGGAANGSLRIRQLNQVPSDVMSFVPLPTATPPTFYVLYSGHFALFDAHCAAGRPPA